ncbi:DIP5 Dicarboxylic amino acid permease [Candida maltosa Xu316]|uniref:Putative dicarboxylic amino acid permease n=1 Tax=Candida maltosa (strain Xu316) TaxID=1245528 RepID=M3JY51_CANMX|nr:putative dicarboxylic amino acid permease [Candida maltosa Xu316]
MSSHSLKSNAQVEVDETSFTSFSVDFSKEDIEQSEAIFHHEKSLSEGLSARLIGMISLVGIFGTGLFLSSGGTLATAGPVGMILSYILVGIVVAANQVCAMEVACLMPVTGSNIRHVEHFVDKALGFALGYVNLYSAIIPSELAATSVVMTYWTDLNPAIFISIFGVVLVGINIYKIRWYGEIEFVFGFLKVLLILGLIIVGLVIDLGGAPNNERLGFRYWIHPGPFAEKYGTGSKGRFLAFWKCVSSTVYSFGGVQSIALLAGETKNPRSSIFRASKRILFRVIFLYWLAVFILSLIVPYNDKAIASSNGNASGSAWVIAVQRSGIRVLPHIINAIVLTSALSASSLGIMQASRSLFGLASNGQAPKIFLKVNRHGLPWVGVVFGCVFLPLAYLSISSGSAQVFDWFQNITSSYLLINWIIFAVDHIALHRALKAQGFSRKDLPHTIRGGQYAGPFSLFFSVLFLLTGGFGVFTKGNWKFANFFSSYFIIPLFLGLYVFGKFFWKTKYIKPSEVQLKALFYDVENRPEPPAKKLKGWEYITLLWG